MKGRFRIRLEPGPNQEPRCVHCGEPATTASYFPPLLWGPLGFRLLSCVECVLAIQGRWPTDFAGREKGVKEFLRRKYGTFLREHDFSEKDKNELGINLRERIELWQKRRNLAQKRVAWNARQYIARIDHFSVFVPEFAEQNFIESLKERFSPWEERHGPQGQQISRILRHLEGEHP